MREFLLLLIIISILMMQKLRLGDDAGFIQGHIHSKQLRYLEWSVP